MSLSPPRPRGPSLNAYRAFEAAARLGGFKAAASELNVSPAAISQHIKTLEDWSGNPLFERHANGIVLNEIGKDILPEITKALDLFGQTTHHLRAHSQKHEIAIATLPAVAMLWLSPRLPALRKSLAPLKISVSAIEQPPNLMRELYDVSIFLRVPTGDKDEIILAYDSITPVCSPHVARALQHHEELCTQTLLMDTAWTDDWEVWRAQAAPQLNLSDGLEFSLYAMAVEDAKNHAGVLMGHECLIEPLIKSGALVAPFESRVETGLALTMQFADNKRTQALKNQFVEALSLG